MISLSISSTFSPVKVSSQVHTQVVVYIKHKYFLAEEKECSPLKSPANGSIAFNKNGQRARFYCNTGFVIKGEKNAVCINGRWSSWPPMCTK